MSKRSSLIQVLLFTVFILFFFVLNLAMPDKSFSERENRELTQVPAFSFEALFSKKLGTKFESYTTDQFPFRDNWTTLKARCEFAVGKQENKGVYLCKDETLIEAYEQPDAQQLETNISAIKSFAESAPVPVYFALIPGSAAVDASLLPKNAPSASETDVIDYCYENSGAKNIDILSALEAHKDDYIFYRTDHHWTTLGAYYGYAAIMTAMGQTATPLSDFTPEVVSDAFYGTVYSKSGISWIKPDAITLYAKQSQATQVTNFSGTEPVAGTMYDYSFLEKKDKYSMFMGGNTALEVVKTGNTDAPRLLILRDSFMDSVTPYLQNNFSEIHIMDLRYYKTQLMSASVTDYIKAHDIDEVLICYGIETFGTDSNVFLIK